MKTVETRGRSRRQQPKSQRRKEKRVSHLQTVRRGGFEESQVICRLWDIVKTLEAGRRELENASGAVLERESKRQEGSAVGVEGGTEFSAEAGPEPGASLKIEKLINLERQLRRQIRVEVRRYFVRRRRRNLNRIFTAVLVIFGVVYLFAAMIGIDRVSGESMYPYLNHGDWILFSRISREYDRNDVVVFEKNGENLVKRIAGLPGDQIEISTSGNNVVINGEAVSIGKPAVEDIAENMGAPLTVMDGQYLVLGDNRRISIDSRDKRMGTVSEAEILGRVILILRLN